MERQDREELDDCLKFRLNHLKQIPVTIAVLRDATSKDPVLSRVLRVYPNGLTSGHTRRTEIILR